ncbi:MAG: translocation/assembly module TamB domain-containing protein [Rhodocyclaceae bacterium]
MTTEPSADTPPGPSTPDSAPPAPRTRRRWLRHAMMAAVAVSAVATGTLAWVIGTETGSRTGVNLAANIMGGMFRVEGWQGRLLDHWQVSRFELHLTGFRLVATQADVRWHVRPLLRGDVRLDWLRLAALDIRSAPSTDAQPDSGPLTDVRLPVAIHAAEVRAAQLTIGSLAAGDVQPPPAVTLTDIAGRVDSDAARHVVDQFAVTTPAGRVSGQAQLAALPPFALQAALVLNSAVQERTVSVDAAVDGSLLAPHIVLRASGEGIDGTADVQAQPFEPVPLRHARLAFTGVDPSRFHADAPHALFDIDADLTPAAAAGVASPGVADWVVSGPLTVVNRAAGAIDQGRIPVERLATTLAWSAGALKADALRIDVPAKGAVTGEVTWQPGKDDVIGRIVGQLRLAGIDPRVIHSAALRMRVNGEATATAGSDVQAFTLKLAADRYRLDAVGEHRAGVLRLSRAELAAGASRVSAAGQLALQGTQAFTLKGALVHFDPQHWVSTAPQGDLNTKFDVTGQLAPAWQVRASLDLGNSQLAGRALTGGGRIALAPARVLDADLNVNVLDNTLQLKGAFGRPGDSLSYKLDASHLNRLGQELAGVVQAEGVLSGTVQAPSGSIVAHVQNLSLPGQVHISRADANARLQDGLDGLFEARIEVGTLRVGKADSEAIVRSAQLVANGRRNAHTAALTADLMRDERVTLRTRGGFAADGFHGQIEQFSAEGPIGFALESPVALDASLTRVALAPARLRAHNGQVELAQTEWTPERLIARGNISGVEVGLLQRDDGSGAARTDRSRNRSLRLGGNWDVTLGPSSSGLVRIFREGGDLILLGDTPVALGLETLEVAAALQDNRLTLNAVANGKRLGAMTLVLSTATRGQGSRISLDQNAPLVGVGHVQMPSLDWVGPFIDANLRTAGSLNGRFNILGTPTAPRGAGDLTGENLEIGLVDQGMRLEKGTLALSFDANQVKLDTLRFTSQNNAPTPDPRLRVLNLPKTGTVTGSGAMQLANGKGNFRIDLDHVGVAQQPNQWILVSGTTRIDTGWDDFALTAQLRADGGFVGVPKGGTPGLSDDVVVRGRTNKEVSTMKLNADVAFDFGNNFLLKAYGINTYLDGVLRLRLPAGEPMRATGSIRARNGVFDGYGQRLTIDRGVVNFQGPLDNPGLNVIALRKGLAVEAGVEVTGSARTPRVRLVSQPNVPETEKLSWMLLGRASEPGTGDAGLLLSAASAAMSDGGEGPVEKLVHGLGLDDINLGQSSTEDRPLQSQVASNATGLGSSVGTSTDAANQVLTLGKRVSARAYLSLEQNFIGTESVVKLTYTLTRYIALVARAGTDNALDLNYSISFR